eukprot:EG_transcript_38584
MKRRGCRAKYISNWKARRSQAVCPVPSHTLQGFAFPRPRKLPRRSPVPSHVVHGAWSSFSSGSGLVAPSGAGPCGLWRTTSWGSTETVAPLSSATSSRCPSKSMSDTLPLT